GLHNEVSNEYAANSSTAVFVLKAPDALFPQKTSFMYFTPIYPYQIVAKDGGGGALFDTQGVGPFYEVNYTPGSFQLIMVRNPHYTPQPSICQIDISFVDNIALTSSYLESGQTDLAPVAPSSVAQILSSNPSLRVFNGPNLISDGLQWNVTTYPFNMTSFRQALAFGINQQSIVTEAFDGFGAPAYTAEGTIPPANTAWYNPSQAQYSFNQTTSLALLQSIGITKGTDGFLQYQNSGGQPNGTDVTLNIWTDVDQTWDTIGASVVQQNLQTLGFKVNENTLTAVSISADFHANIDNIAHSGMIYYSTPGVFLSSPFLMTLPGWDTTWLPSFPPNNLQWEAPLSANTAYYGNLSAYSATADPTAQKTAVNNIQAINAQYLPILTLGYDSYIWVGNTAHFSGWPSSNAYTMMEGSYWNRTAWVDLVPAGSTTNTNTGTGLGSSTTYIIAAIVVIIIVVGAIAYMTTRRGKSTKKTATTTT
ncbi:MAG: ABC transporter substrate-binding protein, partial [Nitrososphaerales archaeon]